MADRPLGRIDARPHADQIKGLIQPAPHLFRGEIPRRSPNIRRFRNPRLHHQWMGTCVGQSGAAVAETSIRTPEGFTDKSEPNPAIDISPLQVYVESRKRAEKEGVRGIFNGEGSIVSYALLAMQDEGFVPWDAWPCTEANERKAQGRTVPQSVIDAPRYKPIKDVRRLTSPDQILEYLGGGYSVWIGVPWPNGAMNVRPNGSFPWSGGQVGGHAVELIDYDLDADQAWIGNSWKGWGDALGCAYTSLKAILKTLSERYLADGTSEACVISEVDGWKQKAKRRRAREVL